MECHRVLVGLLEIYIQNKGGQSDYNYNKCRQSLIAQKSKVFCMLIEHNTIKLTEGLVDINTKFDTEKKIIICDKQPNLNSLDVF